MKSSKYLLPLVLSASLFGGAAIAQTDGAVAPAAQTQVEVENEAAPAPAAAPNIDIDMPEAPDVNVTTPAGNSTSTETHTERSSTTILNDADDVDPVASNSIWPYVLFGILALFLIGLMLSAGRRRTLVREGGVRRTTIIDD